MRKLKSDSIVDVDGESIEFWFYDNLSVAQHLEIEKMLAERGGGQTSLLLCAFLVCALDSTGKRLYSAVEYKQLAGRLPQKELVKACLAIGSVEAQPDPKS